MNDNKCFCHFNGYEVKDAYARSELEKKVGSFNVAQTTYPIAKDIVFHMVANNIKGVYIVNNEYIVTSYNAYSNNYLYYVIQISNHTFYTSNSINLDNPPTSADDIVLSQKNMGVTLYHHHIRLLVDSTHYIYFQYFSSDSTQYTTIAQIIDNIFNKNKNAPINLNGKYNGIPIVQGTYQSSSSGKFFDIIDLNNASQRVNLDTSTIVITDTVHEIV